MIARWGDEARIERYLAQHSASPALEFFLRSQHGPGHYGIPPEAIRSVILGAKVSQDDEERVRATLEGVKTIALRRARLDRYGGLSIV